MFDTVVVGAVCPPGLGDEDLLGAMTEAQRAINSLTARHLACAAELGSRRLAPVHAEVPGGESARWGQVSEFLDAEVGAALTISRPAADRLIDTALGLARLPATAAAFAAGELDLSRVRLICLETCHLDDGAAATVDARVIDRAPAQGAARWKPALNAFAVTFADRMPATQER